MCSDNNFRWLSEVFKQIFFSILNSYIGKHVYTYVHLEELYSEG